MKTIAVIFGSRSAEHDVSVVTAIASIIKPLELTKQFRVEAVYISKDGQWFWDDELKDIKLFSSGKIDDFLAKSPKASVQFDGGLTLTKPTGLGRRPISRKVDVVFPATHGTYGEDGSLMGLLRLANVPFVGCDMDASVLAMDKVLAKLMVINNSIATPKMEFSFKYDYLQNKNKLVDASEKNLKYPMFVKPAHLGSSIGISRASNRQELENAIEVAFHYDDKALVEEAVENLIEVTLPIMGNDQLKPALLEQPSTKAEDFFDFDTKYMKGGKKGEGKSGRGAQGYSQIPADLPKDLYVKAEKVGLDSFRALGCSGLARIDMLIDKKTGIVYFNEANPLPGSLYSHNWRAAGISNVELVSKLVELAEERWQAGQRQTTTFSTNYLKQF